MHPTAGLDRRDFLAAGVAAVGVGLWPDRSHGTPFQDDGKARQALDRLLDSYRRHLATGAYAGAPGGGNHIPMTLIAAFRLGATAEQLDGYVAHFRLRPDDKPIEIPAAKRLNHQNWRDHLGRADRHAFQHMFADWAQDAPLDAILKECVPVFANGMAGAFSHDLIRLAYGIDLGSAEEMLSGLAGWAASHRPAPAYDATAAAIAPDALLATILANTVDLVIRPDGGNFGPIAFRLDQVHAAEAFTAALRVVRIPEPDPLAHISELIMEAFTKTHDFTLLHALTTCQAMRLVLPFAGDARACLSAFWHSACAAILTVRKVRPHIERDGVAAPVPAALKLIHPPL